MKIYWVSSDWLPKCFFRLSREDAQQECDFRMREKGAFGNWFVEEEEIADDKFGRCKNEDEPRLPYQMDCAVGTIRKLRNGIPEDEDDGTCGTCPYFL